MIRVLALALHTSLKEAVEGRWGDGKSFALVEESKTWEDALAWLERHSAEVFLFSLSGFGEVWARRIQELKKARPELLLAAYVSDGGEEEHWLNRAMTEGVDLTFVLYSDQEPGKALTVFENRTKRRLPGGQEVASVPVPSAPVTSVSVISGPVKKEIVEAVRPKGVLSYPTLTPKMLAIGSSTGGPQALLSLFSSLKGRMPEIPILVTQHMPPGFTTSLAEHIGLAFGKECHEAVEGEPVGADKVLVAPGDYHMGVVEKNGQLVIALNQGPPENFCRPAVDVMLRHLAPIYGARLLTLILTGMGQDGMLGSKLVVEHSGTVIAQDEASSVVWGMPKAVAENGYAKEVLPLDMIGDYVLKACGAL